MVDPKDLKPPSDLDRQICVKRWDQMQERHLAKRAERFQVITGVLRESHFDELRRAGFAYVDCFWRCDGDAVFGGLRGKMNVEAKKTCPARPDQGE